MEYIISACSGKRIDVKRGQRITVMDIEGGQVADFFAVSVLSSEEFLSPAVTLDCHESLKLNVGDELYTNLYHPMFRILSDDVGVHDLLFHLAARRCITFSTRTAADTRTALTISTAFSESIVLSSTL